MTNKKNITAFSLIELSIVIAIVGILIAAISQVSDLVIDSKLHSARSLTQNSPVVNIKNLTFWLDSVSERSFIESEVSDGATISRWADISPEASAASYFVNNSLTESDHPTYKESCVNSLPCVYFNGVAKINSQKSLMVGIRYVSVFLVLTKYEGESTENSQIIVSHDDASNANWNTGSGIFAVGTNQGKLVYAIADNGTQSAVAGNFTNVLAHDKTNYIYSVIDDGSSSIYQYVNGAVANEAGDSGAFLKFIGNVNIGGGLSVGNTAPYNDNGYKGGIAEIIVFTRALTTSERKSVEQYLSKKWAINLAS